MKCSYLLNGLSMVCLFVKRSREGESTIRQTIGALVLPLWASSLMLGASNFKEKCLVFAFSSPTTRHCICLWIANLWSLFIFHILQWSVLCHYLDNAIKCLSLQLFFWPWAPFLIGPPRELQSTVDSQQTVQQCPCDACVDNYLSTWAIRPCQVCLHCNCNLHLVVCHKLCSHYFVFVLFCFCNSFICYSTLVEYTKAD